MKTKTKVLRYFSGFLLCAACAIAFFWFYWLAPWRHLNCSGTWWFDHTPRRQWMEIQKQLRRSGADHDSRIALGYYGDKKWVEWVIRIIKPRQEIGSDGEGPDHLPSALWYMTNQRLTNDVDWVVWWSTNKNRTQVEWIRDGFAKTGINLHQSLTTNDIAALLKSVSTKHGYLRYNTLRWLRDAGFKPGRFDLASVSVGERDAITSGLVSYALWLGEHQNDPGKLPILGIDSGESCIDAWVERPFGKWLVKLILITMVVGGVLLLRHQPSPKSHS